MATKVTSGLSMRIAKDLIKEVNSKTSSGVEISTLDFYITTFLAYKEVEVPYPSNKVLLRDSVARAMSLHLGVDVTVETDNAAATHTFTWGSLLDTPESLAWVTDKIAEAVKAELERVPRCPIELHHKGSPITVQVQTEWLLQAVDRGARLDEVCRVMRSALERRTGFSVSSCPSAGRVHVVFYLQKPGAKQ